MLKITCCFFIILSAFFSAYAQQRPGACCRASHFNIDNLPPPIVITGIGNSSLKITTDSHLAQKYFNQGLSLLHCFWEFEAYRAFKEVARIDPKCAMAYWGMHAALPDNSIYQEKRAELIEKAVQMSETVTEHEKLYINAYYNLFKLSGDKATKAYNDEMERLIDLYPDDKEAKLFYALSLMSGYNLEGKPNDGQVYCQMLLRNVLTVDPDNAAAHHYWIHAMEAEHPERAFESAEKLAKLAPNSGHMVHMPGHIYYRNGDYKRAHQSFLSSMAVDKAYMQNQNLSASDVWNYIHNLDYMVANCAESGHYREGLEFASKLQLIETDPKKRNGFAGDEETIVQGGKIAQAKLSIRYGRWADAAEKFKELLQRRPSAGTYEKTYYKTMISYIEGMEAVENRDLKKALAAKQSLQKNLYLISKKFKEPADFLERYFADKKELLEVASLELEGFVQSLKGDYREAVETLKKAIKQERELGYQEPPKYPRPVMETLAKVYKMAGDFKNAVETYKQELKLRPNSGHALFGIAEIFVASGDKEEAQRAYTRFLEVWQGADSDLFEVIEAKKWLSRIERAEIKSPSAAVLTPKE